MTNAADAAGGDARTIVGRTTVARTGWFLLPSVVGTALPLLCLPIYTRVLSPDEYGAWVLATTYGVLLSSFVNLALPLSYERNFFEYQEPRARAALLYGVVGLVLLALAVGLAGTWWLREPLAVMVTRSAAHASLLFWTAAALGVSSIKTYFTMYFRNMQYARAYAVVTVGESALAVGITVYLVAVLRTGAVGLAWGPLLAAGIVLVIVLVVFVRHLRPAFDPAPVLASLRLAFPLMPRILVSVVGTQADKLIVGVVTSTGGAAVYGVAQKIAGVVFTLMTAMDNVFRPRTYQLMFGGGENRAREIGVMLTPFAYLSVLGALVVGAGAEEAVRLAAPPAFGTAVPMVAVLVVYYAIMFFGKQPQLTFARRTDLITVHSVITVSVSVPLTLLGARVAGGLGAAWGTLLGGVVSVVIVIVLGQRFAPIAYEWGRLAFLFGFLMVTIAASQALLAGGAPYAVRIAAKVATVVVFLAIGMRLGIVRALALAAGPSTMRA